MNRLLSFSFNMNVWTNAFFLPSFLPLLPFLHAVGVGFSYSTDPTTDYELGDRQAAKDNYAVILAFFEKFPQYLPNDFVISSESWGGHYIPTLAVRIVREQAKPSASPKVNFVGFLVGNPFTSWVNNRQATVKALVGHSLVSYPTAAAWEEQCADLVVAPQYLLGNCIEIEAKMNMEMADLNPYVRTLEGVEAGREERREKDFFSCVVTCNIHPFRTALTLTPPPPLLPQQKNRRSPTPSVWTEAPSPASPNAAGPNVPGCCITPPPLKSRHS